MKRTDYITRTVTETHVTVVIADPVSETMEQQTIVLMGTFTTVEQVKKALAKSLQNKVLVKIVELNSFNKLYGVLKEDFMAAAVEIDEKGNPLENQEATE